VNKEFDVRVWVLVKSFTPLCAYIYENAYIRVSSESYQLSSLARKKAHLTNYTVNYKDKNEDGER
jgi:hypothetical protein